MSDATLILSDTHLGRPRGGALSARALRPLWTRVDRLILNGDVAEIHHPHHWSDAARAILELTDLCEDDGVQLTFLSGNHDPFLTDIRCLHLADRRVFVTHGDVLHPAVAPWSPAAGRMREARTRALAHVDPETHDELEVRLAAAQAASHAEWEKITEEAGRSTVLGMLARPWKLVEVLRYWRALPQLASDFAAQCAPDARFIVVGHSHHPGVWRVGERWIINTGAFSFPGRPRAVLVRGDELAVHRIRRLGREYYLDPHAVRRFQLSDAHAIDARNTRPGNSRPSAAPI